MNTHNNGRMMGGAFLCAWFGAAAMSAQVGIYGIGNLGGGEDYSEVRAAILTSNGIVAVGGANGQSWNTTANGGGGTAPDTAVLWTKGNGAGVLTALPPIVAPNIDNVGRVVTAGDITEISPGNLVIAARSYYDGSAGFSALHPNAKESVLYSYTFNGTSVSYGSTTVLTPNISANNQNATNAISRDGAVVYGFANVPGGMVSTRWTAGTGQVSLGQIGSDVANIPSPRAISSDGSVMVGTTTLNDLAGTTNAFIYRSTGGFTNIGTLAGGTNSQSVGVSGDGSLVFGSSQSTAHPNGEAFFWNANTSTFTALGTPNDSLVAQFGGITGDGSAGVLTFGDNAGSPSSFVTEIYNSHGMYDLATVFAAGGVSTSGWSNLFVWGISPDGQLIYGTGNLNGTNQGFVAELPLGLVAAIPEPSTYAALGGLAALALAIRARYRPTG